MAYADRHKVTKKLTGRWVGEVDTRRPDGTEVRYRKRFASKGEADGYEAYIKATGHEPESATRAKTGSFREVAERLETREPRWAKERVTSQRLAFAVTHLGDIDVTMVRRAELERYVDKIMKLCGHRGQPPANNTINNYLSVVRRVLDYAHQLELIPGVPSIPRAGRDGKKREAVSVPMENAICNILTSRGMDLHAFLVRVLAGTGMRRGELYALRADQIETPERIEHTGWMLTSEQTKTNEARWCPIVPEYARKLRAIIAAGKLPKPAQLSEAFRAAALAAGDTQDLTLHCLRHTTATRLAQVCSNALLVAKLLGHSTGLMTSRYFHPEKEVLFEVAKKVQHAAGEMSKTGEVVPLKTQQNQAQLAS